MAERRNHEPSAQLKKKNDDDEIRTHAPEGNALAGRRVNHSATSSCFCDISLKFTHHVPTQTIPPSPLSYLSCPLGLVEVVDPSCLVGVEVLSCLVEVVGLYCKLIITHIEEKHEDEK